MLGVVEERIGRMAHTARDAGSIAVAEVGRIRGVWVRNRYDVAKAGTSGERLAVRGIGEEVAADRAVEEASCAMNHGAAVRIGGPCEPDRRRDVIVAGIHATGRHAWIARKQNAFWESRSDRRFHSGDEVHGHELSIGVESTIADRKSTRLNSSHLGIS